MHWWVLHLRVNILFICWKVIWSSRKWSGIHLYYTQKICVNVLCGILYSLKIPSYQSINCYLVQITQAVGTPENWRLFNSEVIFFLNNHNHVTLHFLSNYYLWYQNFKMWWLQMSIFLLKEYIFNFCAYYFIIIFGSSDLGR